ncbi:MAG: formate dehydrogenase subunit gamma [Candidatus Accumulibacter sp.]|nr:formate dehydrogenase subunit gamma [Accumulibacter sp.]MBA4093270.1 formate dehydrogenase subunit gamma [Accumulibacter sp.]
MTTSLFKARAGSDTWPWLFCLLAVCCALAAARPALAEAPAAAARSAETGAAAQQKRQQEQPLNNAPVWREVRSGDAHFTTVRGPETGVLIQSEGQTWRALRNGPVTLYGGVLLLAVIAAILAFYKIKGPLTLHDAPSGRMIERFNRFERIVHWGTAGTFLILAVTGLAILFGKHVIVPIFGHTLFGYLMIVGKNVHNYVGPVFLGFTLVMIAMWARDNLWHNCDAEWIRKGGGLATGEHVPSGRFNFGEKTWFWIGVTVLGLTVAGSGLVLDFPNFGQVRQTMQTFNLIHVIGALVLLMLSLGHIYMGTIGAHGAYESMKTGYVDETWAHTHHELWYKEIKAGKHGQSPARPPAAREVVP